MSGAWAAKKPLRAPTYFCNPRSPFLSRSVPAPRPPAPRSAPAPRCAPAPSFSVTPAPRSAPLHPIFGPLRSVFRSAHAPLKCSDFQVVESKVKVAQPATVEISWNPSLWIDLNRNLHKCLFTVLGKRNDVRFQSLNFWSIFLSISARMGRI